MSSSSVSSSPADGRPSAGRIGIIAGSGPEAGIDLFSKVLREQRRVLGDDYRGDVDSPNVTLLSVPELGHSMNLPETEDLVWGHLRDACERIAAQVDVYAIACNTLYFYEPAIRSLNLGAALCSPVECVRDESMRRGGETMALLGSAPVTDFGGTTSPYARLADTVDLELHSEPGRVHQLIESIKLEGGSTAELETEFGSIVQTLDADAALLACTELPLLTGQQADIELVDVTLLLARALVSGSV